MSYEIDTFLIDTLTRNIQCVYRKLFQIRVTV
jgi:hypothetical protein